MKQISETQFLSPKDVNAAQIFCKEEKCITVPDVTDAQPEGKKLVRKKKNEVVKESDLTIAPMYNACFSVKEGEVCFTDKWPDLEPVQNIVESFGLTQVLPDLYIAKDNVHSAALYTKDGVTKVCLRFKFGAPVYAGPFDDTMLATKFILDTF